MFGRSGHRRSKRVRHGLTFFRFSEGFWAEIPGRFGRLRRRYQTWIALVCHGADLTRNPWASVSIRVRPGSAGGAAPARGNLRSNPVSRRGKGARGNAAHAIY